MDFYGKIEGNHIVKAPYIGEGREEELFWVNKPEKYDGDPDTGMDYYNLALTYRSFVNGSVDTPLEEFTYLPEYRIVRKRQ